MLKLWVLMLGIAAPMLVTASIDEDNPLEASDTKLDYNEALEIPWVELKTQVKQLPEDADLTEVVLDKLPKNLRLYADLKNIRISDQDHVTRLWIVVRSKQGAYNGSYEGFRCATKEYKAYAYANPQRQNPLRVIEFPRWRHVQQRQYREELMQSVLCHGTRPHPLSEIIDNVTKDPNRYQPPY